jgi:hypothetical protein
MSFFLLLFFIMVGLWFFDKMNGVMQAATDWESLSYVTSHNNIYEYL